MKTIAVIPARMGSSRFPGKPLAPLLGMSMIEHVYRRVAMADGIDGVFLATCDEEIKRTGESFGAPVIMTSPAHERASDRVAEACERMEADIVVMVQGDEPMTHPDMIRTAVEPLIHDPSIPCSNLIKRITRVEEFRDPNTVKVVMDGDGFALYFSREPIPNLGELDLSQVLAYKQVCVIPFRRDFLLTFAQLEPTALERAESIDMIRALEHGYRVALVEEDFETQAVDTPEDLVRVQRMLSVDPVTPMYSGDEARQPRTTR